VVEDPGGLGAIAHPSTSAMAEEVVVCGDFTPIDTEVGTEKKARESGGDNSPSKSVRVAWEGLGAGLGLPRPPARALCRVRWLGSRGLL